MAEQDRIVQCLDLPLDWLTLLKMCIVTDADGNFYLNMYYANCEDCETLTPAVACITNETIEQLLRNIIVEDECGNPAISLTGNICDACD